MRKDLNLPTPEIVPLTERETEAAWALHGKIFYLAIRKFVYGWPIPDDLSQVIADDVGAFLKGAAPIFIDSVKDAAKS